MSTRYLGQKERVLWGSTLLGSLRQRDERGGDCGGFKKKKKSPGMETDTTLDTSSVVWKSRLTEQLTHPQPLHISIDR